MKCDLPCGSVETNTWGAYFTGTKQTKEPPAAGSIPVRDSGVTSIYAMNTSHPKDKWFMK